MSDKPLAWLVTAAKKPRFVRACWTTPPTQDQLTVAQCDGDIVTPLYAAPQAQELEALRAERDALKAAMEKIDLKAEAGLCYFTLESAREFLKDIRGIVAAAQEQTP